MVAPSEVAPTCLMPYTVNPDKPWVPGDLPQLEGMQPQTAVFLSAGSQAIRETVSLVKEQPVDRIPQPRTPAHQPQDKIELVDGKLMRIISYFDGDVRYRPLTERTTAARVKQYKAMGLYTEAVTEDPVRGSNVEFITVVDPRTGEPAAGLRKIHATEHTLDELPSYLRCKENFTEEGRRLLAASAAGRPVVEIVALWKDPDYSTDAKIAVYKEALQRSVERDELWIVGVVAAEYRGLLQTYGPHVVRSIGKPTPMKEETAPKKVRLYPAIIDPHDFYDNLITEVQEAKAKQDYTTSCMREVMLWHFLDGLNWRYLPENTVHNIEMMCDGRLV